MSKYIGKIGNGYSSLAVSLDGIDIAGIKVDNLHARLNLHCEIQNLNRVGSGKVHYISCKGKPSISTVKAYVKEHNLQKFYALWRSDSSYWKDDIVELVEYQ